MGDAFEPGDAVRREDEQVAPDLPEPAASGGEDEQRPRELAEPAVSVEDEQRPREPEESAASVGDDLKRALECVLLVSGGPVTPEQAADTLGVPPERAREVLDDLRRSYTGRGLQIQVLAGGYQLCTRPEYSTYVQRFLHLEHLEPLSQAALETLAIIAYRQPVTRAEIEAVRGVRVEHVLDRLLERHLIRELGRRPTVGRPILYGTTEGFLRHFGLRDLQALPPLTGDDPRGILVRPADVQPADVPHG